MSSKVRRSSRGSAIILDDTSRAANSRKWQSNVNQVLSDTGNTFRYEGYFVGCTARVGKDIDSQFRELFHFTLEIKRRSMRSRFIRVKPMIPTMDTAHGKTYWHYPRIDIPGRGRRPVPRIDFHPSHFQTGPMLTWPDYEHKKAAFMGARRREQRRDLRIEREVGSTNPTRLAQVIEIAKRAGVSYAHIGKELGISHQAVSKIASRASRVDVELED